MKTNPTAQEIYEIIKQLKSDENWLQLSDIVRQKFIQELEDDIAQDIVDTHIEDVMSKRPPKASTRKKAAANKKVENVPETS